MREIIAEAEKCKICRVVIKIAEKNKAAIMDKSWEIREGFPEEVTFGWRPEGGEGGSHLDPWGRQHSRWRNKKCKGPEVGRLYEEQRRGQCGWS